MEEHRPVVLRVGAKADRGLVREENQDRISRLHSPLGDVFIVADGMGGHEGGATAAQMVIDGLGEELGGLDPGTSPEAALQEAATRTNARIYGLAQGTDPRLTKMGATCVLALISGHRVWIAHAGDSRAYLWRGGRLTRLTRDHTRVQAMIDRQILSEDEARDHPDSSVITRAFGQKPEVELEIAPPRDLCDGDRLLLCSDGLSGYVGDAALAEVLATGGEAQAAADALIALALRAGGEDNVSVQLIAVQGGPAPAAMPPLADEASAPAARRGLPGFLLVLPLILVGFLAGTLLPWREWIPGHQPAETLAEPEVPTEPSTSGPADATDPAAESVTLETEPAPGIAEEILEPLKEDPKEVPEETPVTKPPGQEPARVELPKKTPEIVLLAKEDKLKARLSPLGQVTLEAPIEPFKEGAVYFRTGYGAAADKIVKALQAKGEENYAKKPWPSGNSFFPTAAVAVAARGPRGPAGGAAPTPPAPPATEVSPAPKAAVLSPSGVELAEPERAALQAFLGKVPDPEPLEGKLLEHLTPGTVYWRHDFAKQGEELAGKLGYQNQTWPFEIATEQDGVKLLVVLRPQN